MPRVRVQGKNVLPKRWPDEQLWAITGHDGTFPFHCKVVVAGGVVRSAPPLMAWAQGRLWIDAATLCAERGWIVTHVDTELARLREQEKARNARGSVQLGMELGELDGDEKPTVPAATPERQQRRSAH